MYLEISAPPTQMKKTKLDERLENAMNAFFETPPDQSRFAMTYTGESAIVVGERTFGEKADKWASILREIFLFGPGVFSLFYLTLTIAYFFPALGFSFQGYLMYVFAVFLTYAGAGSINKLKNMAVPGVVIAMALMLVLVAPLIAGRDLSDLYFWYSIYMFPAVLIIAKLVQSWVSDK